MFHVVIIGAGQLGSRHLQALAKSDFPLSITVVDPSVQSLEVSRIRFEEITPNPLIQTINFVSSIGDLETAVDFAIIATSADVRLQVLSELLSVVKVSTLLLEKVLFQSETELILAGEMLQKHNVQTWVNCPRRIFPMYQRVKQLLQGDQPIHFLLEGYQWGVACNSIHFIDLFAWLSNDKLVEIDVARLDPLVLPSKRSGFIELSGILQGKSHRGSTFELIDAEKFKGQMKISIETPDQKITINELNTMACVESSDGVLEEWSCATPFQSELTQLVAKNILLNQQCGLTPYLESAGLHRLFLQGISRHLEQVTGTPSAGRCPIT